MIVMAMSGFICHDDYLQKTAKLTDEEVGRLFRALMRYHATGEAEDIDGRESIAFDFIREDIDRTEAAYRAKCEKNRNNRLAAIANDRQQPLTIVNVRPQKEKEKEKEKDKENNNTIRKKNDSELLAMFERFWDEYPRKTDKKKAYDSFKKIKPDEAMMQTMLTAISKQKQSQQWQEDGGRFIPHPTTWLNNQRWEDQLPAGNGGRKVAAQQYEQRDYSGQGDTMDDVLDRLMEG